MAVFIRHLSAEVQKTRHLHFYLFHLVTALLVPALFLAYYTFSPWDNHTRQVAYYQILGVGFPFLSGLFCSMLAEQEREAGNFQGMLAAPQRLPVLYSKMALLLLPALGSVLISCGLFGLIYGLATGLEVGLILFGTSVVLYIWHLFLALGFSKELNLCMGIVESLISALLLTGLGDGSWMYFPCAWGSRLSGLFAQGAWVKPGTRALTECRTAAALCALATAAGLLLCSLWFSRWNGRKNED